MSTPQSIDSVYGSLEVSACRFDAGADHLVHQPQQVVVEDILTLDIRNAGTFNLMWTPTERFGSELGYIRGEGILGADAVPELFALAAGFCLSEGIIAELDQLATLAYCDKAPGVVRVELTGSEPVQLHRKDVLITSSCSLCTRVDMVENNIFELKRLEETLSVSPRAILQYATTMQSQQRIFADTGGTHAALLFDQTGARATCEDLGRHNALDKALGMSLLASRSTRGGGVMISSRISTELVLKSIRAGIELLAGVGAPTSMAVELAERFGLTLCGFVRDERLTVYTHPQRLNVS